MGATGKTFKPDTSIPSLSGKVVFVTGGNTGLGRASIEALAKHNPACIYLSGRNPTKCEEAITAIKASSPNSSTPIKFIQCDLSSLSSVKTAAEAFLAQSQRLDILMCNAGVMALPPGTTSDGYEIQFGTNHMGHALLIKLLLPMLLETAKAPGSDVRIISLTSQGMQLAPTGGVLFDKCKTGKRCDPFKSLSGWSRLRLLLITTNKDRPDMSSGVGLVTSTWTRYGQSKLANILYASALARRYPSILSVSIHPGVVDTQLARGMQKGSLLSRGLHVMLRWQGFKPVDEGAWNQLWAATAERGELVNGAYYEPVAVLGKHSKYSSDEVLAGRLWEWTQEELKGYEI